MVRLLLKPNATAIKRELRAAASAVSVAPPQEALKFGGEEAQGRNVLAFCLPYLRFTL